jgi:LuxR family transcriptional regulator, maltose regulon positive regulatory protein
MVSDVPLARARLIPLRTHQGWVERRRVMDRLDRAANVPVTLVVAPSGFGKSGLAAQWAARQECPVAWLTLDERDNAVGSLAVMLVNAINQAIPGAIVAPLRYLDFAGAEPDAALVATHLLNDLSDLSDDLAIVIDDAHLITAPGPSDLLEALATARIPGLRIMICSRTDPPWTLADLRTSGRLVEVRAGDLRLNVAEVAEYAAHAGWEGISAAETAGVLAASSGWLTAVRLLCAMRHGADTPAAGPESPEEAMAWLLQQVIATMPLEERGFLLRLAIPGRICQPLAEALGAGAFARGRSGALYERLIDDGLFLSRPNEGGWSTFHPRVRKAMLGVLAETTTEQEMRWLHREAQAWFLSHGWFDEALGHAWTAGGAAAAAEIIRIAWAPAFEDERWDDVESWLVALPPEVVQADASLMLALAWLARHRDNLAGASIFLAQAEAALPHMLADARAILAAEIDVLKGGIAYLTGDSAAAERLSRQAVSVLPTHQSFSLGAGYLFCLLSQFINSPATVDEAAARALAVSSMLPPAVTTRIWSAVRCIAFQQGNLRRTVRISESLAARGRDHGAGQMEAWGEAFAALSAYVLDDLEGSIAAATGLMGWERPVDRVAAREAMFCMALAYEAKGQRADADLSLDRIEELLINSRTIGELDLLEAARAWIAYRRGDLAAARSWYAGWVEPEGLHASHSFIDDRVVAATIALGLQIDVPETMARVDRYLQGKTMADTLMRRVELLLIRAQGQYLLSDREGARASVEDALRESEPGELTRTYLDRGPGVIDLLDLATSPAVAAEAARLRGLAASALHEPPGRSVRQPAARAGGGSRLSEREEEVLELVAQRLTNKEIGTILRISPLTVKRHTINIYAKLGVASRRQAIQFALERSGATSPAASPELNLTGGDAVA